MFLVGKREEECVKKWTQCLILKRKGKGKERKRPHVHYFHSGKSTSLCCSAFQSGEPDWKQTKRTQVPTAVNKADYLKYQKSRIRQEQIRN